MTLDELLAIDPYSLSHERKQQVLKEILNKLVRFHNDHCPEYARILKAQGYDATREYECADLPFIPVRMFKLFKLCSVPSDKIAKILTSSGTSGQAVSRIFLDADNVRAQSRTLNAIIQSFLGKKRLPLLLLDTCIVKKDRTMYSARGAGIIGFSLFGYDTTYAMRPDMSLDLESIKNFFEEHSGEQILLFGYTYMIWQFVIKTLEELKLSFKLNNAILFHIGGWKKLKDEAVSTQEYNRRIKARLGNVQIYNYYGMAEQLGSVFVECEYGHMHCSNFSDVIIRRAKDFSKAPPGEKGLLELLSVLPKSYPGPCLLTEDEGTILGEDDCPCGRLGKYFKIHGRIKNAELRGCSDTYEKK